MNSGVSKFSFPTTIYFGGGSVYELPQRLFEKLPDGPAKGRCVDKDGFSEMCTQYYELMGWDDSNGNPRDGKLRDLGLEWAI